MRLLWTVWLAALYVMAKPPGHTVFTAEDMLSAPRPQAPVVGPDGKIAISVVDHWDPKADITTRHVHLLSLNHSDPSPASLLFTSAPSEVADFFWLSNDSFAYVNGSCILGVSFQNAAHTTSLLQLPAGISATVFKYEPTRGLLFFSAQVWDNGEFEEVDRRNKEFEERGTTGVVFDELFVRHWDTWRTPGKSWTIGMVKLAPGDKLSQPSFVNVLKGTSAVSPMDPIEYTVSATHLAINIKSLHLPPAQHTRTDIHLLPFTASSSFARPLELTTYAHGAIDGVTFSPDGSKLAWLEMAQDGYESDKRVVVVYDLKKGKSKRWTEDWDRSPSSISFSTDAESLYLLAEHEGKVLPYHITHPDYLPTPLHFNHTSTSLTPLSSTTILLTITSMTAPADTFVLDLASPSNPEDPDKVPSKLHRLTDWSKKHIAGRLDDIRIEELWFTGAEGWKVHAWVVKPAGWKEGEKHVWPMAFFVHGGPQGAWEDAWSLRWNPVVFASMGYVVVAVNPTGSTGYGQEFTDRIQGEWGGRPYKDLVAGYHAALEKYPEIDPERTAALGASYGGFMMNWINGHNGPFGFKCLVCHDGIFSTLNAYYTTDEVWFPVHDVGGTPVNNRLGYERWNPMNHVGEWETPELVIHSGRDYRLVDGEGFAAFTALQTQGVPSRLLYFPDENHWVLKPHNSRKWHYEVFRWLDEWVGHGRKEVEGRGEEIGLVVQ